MTTQHVAEVELNGVLFDVLDGPIEGFGIPGSRAEPMNRPQQHGDFPVPQYLPSRPLRWTSIVLGDDVDGTLDQVAAMVGAFAPLEDGSTLALTIRLGTKAFRVIGQPRRAEPDLRTLFAAPPTVRVNCEFVATDPRIYSDDELLQSTGTGGTTGGLAFPHGFPHGFGTVVGSTVTASNDGNAPTYPLAVITATGDVTSPFVENVTTGKVLEVLIALAAGDTLTIDPLNRTVTLNGMASRSNLVNRPTRDDWWPLVPGENVVRLGAASGSGTLDLTWRHAWWR